MSRYKRHGVRTLPELLRKHGHPEPPPPKIEQVRQRIEEGQSVRQIAREIGITEASVYNHVYMLRKNGRLPGKNPKELPVASSGHCPWAIDHYAVDLTKLLS